jgi:hypothetical protein
MRKSLAHKIVSKKPWDELSNLTGKKQPLNLENATAKNAIQNVKLGFTPFGSYGWAKP